MVHLNIPLSRAISTTRHSRRVVWLLVLLFVVVGLITLWFSTLWFTRDTIYHAAPTGTQIAMRFFLNNSTSKSIFTLFENIPLISSRAITLEEIKPFIHGEFAIFINENGSYSVAIRTDKDHLPNSLFDSQNITYKSISNSIVLLSNKIESIDGLPIIKSLLPPFYNPSKKWIGELVTSSAKKRNFVFSTKSQFEIYLPKITQSQTSFNNIPDNTIAYLSLPVSTPEQSNNSINAFLPMINHTFDDGFLNILQNIMQKNGSILLTQNDNNLNYFIKTEQIDNKHPIDLSKTLQSIIALKSPIIKKSSLEDGSIIHEIVIDPDSINVEQITVQGIQVKKVNIQNKILMTGILNNALFLTNSEEMIKNALINDKKSKNTICEGNLAGFSIKEIQNISDSHKIFLNPNVLDIVSERFSYIGYKNNRFSSQINLCN